MLRISPKIFRGAFCVFAVSAVLLLGGCCNRMCTASASASAAPMVLAPTAAVGSAEAGDTLKVHVAGEDDLSGPYTVTQDGTVSLPLVGAIGVAGKTPDEIVSAIADAYRDGYLVAPIVSVEIERGKI